MVPLQHQYVGEPLEAGAGSLSPYSARVWLSARLLLPLVIATSLGGCNPRTTSEPQTSGLPEIVGPGSLSTSAVEHNAAVTPDGSALYFTRTTAPWGESGRSTILVARAMVGGWSEPEPASFSGQYNDSDAFVSPDGRRLFFVSDRPAPDSMGGGNDIWVVDLIAGQERAPVHLASVNSPSDEYSPVTSADGTLYFASARTGGSGQGDLYLAEPNGDGFDTPRTLGPVVNSPFGEWNVVVDPAEQTLVFESSGRALNQSEPGDLYVAFMTRDGWSRPVPLNAINTAGSDLMPKFSPGGDTLFFASSMARGATHTDIFSVDWAPLAAEARMAPSDVLVAVSRSGHELVVIDPQTLSVVRRLPTGTGPHEVTALPGARAAVGNYGIFPTPHDTVAVSHPGWQEVPDGNTISVVDLVTGTTLRTFAIEECQRTHGILASTSGRTLWATCEEEAAVVEIDLETESIRRWDTGGAGSHRLVATDGDRYLTVANVEAGTVTVIDRQSESATTLDTGTGSEGMDRGASESVWVAASGEDALSEVTPYLGTVVRTLPSGGRFPISVSVDAERETAWIAHIGSRAVHSLDLSTGEVTGTTEFASAPLRVLAVPASRHVYISLPRENAIAVVDRATHREVGRVSGIMEVDGLVWSQLPAPQDVRTR